MESERKTLICFDALNWMSQIFWNNNADLEYCADPWEALRSSDHKVGMFVSAARKADYELVVVISGSCHDANAIATYERRREEEIRNEKRNVCLRADSLLAESFQNHGAQVVRPVYADAIDVLAAFADSVENAIVVSGNHKFFCYDVPLRVSRSFTVRGGKLLLPSPVTKYDADSPRPRSKMSFVVQRNLALPHETWSAGLVAKYRPSLTSHGKVHLGSSSSSDRRMGSLHAVARPLRAAVYASLGEQLALERIPEWCNDKMMVVWTETEVVADAGLSSVLKDPLSVVEWLEKHDTPAVQMEPWRVAERHFNICSLAAELVTLASQGNWNMHKCMDILSTDENIVKRTSPGVGTSVEQEIGPNTSLNARRIFAKPNERETANQHQSSTPVYTVETATNTNANTSSSSRGSIFGAGRPREEVLKEREKLQRHVPA